MQHFDYILCHGSGNRFLLFDAVKSPQLERLTAPMVAELCRQAAPNDGLLLLVRRGEEYGMRMFNTDGSEAEMCGNGIRCVEFPEDGHPTMCVEAINLTGDARDELVVWDYQTMYIYTQDDGFMENAYAPVKYPHYNGSNYRGEYSYPSKEYVI